MDFEIQNCSLPSRYVSFANTIYCFFFFYDIWHFHLFLLSKVCFALLSSFFHSTFFFLTFHESFKVKHGEPSKDVGSLRLVTRSIMNHSSSASHPSTVSIHISDDKEEDVLIEGFLTSQWESKATPQTLEQLRDYHIPTSIELRIPSPNENMAMPPKGCVALYPYLFKVRVRLPLHSFINLFLDLLMLPLLNLTQ